LAGQGPRQQSAARDSCATYILHPLVIVGLASALQSVALYPLLKFLIFAPVAVLTSFAVGHLVRLLPGVRNVL
jgi:glucan biosynthesis protein C